MGLDINATEQNAGSKLRIVHTANGIRFEEATAAPQATVDNVKSIVELIGRNNNAKYPHVHLLVDDNVIKLSRAGDRARVPGSINVVDKDSQTWLGRIHLDGRFESTSRGNEWTASLMREIVPALQRFGENPDEIAKEYGRKRGHCCFCLLPLTDKSSLHNGYGRTCAKNYNLKYEVVKGGDDEV